MIKLQDLTPSIYYTQSRDFQFIGRLYDIVLNYIKTNAASLYNLPIGKNLNEQLLNLLAMTLGLKTTKNYNSKQLLAVCSVLPTILKHKGSLQAVVLVTDALLAAEGVKQPLDYTLIPGKGITLYVAQELEDLTLFTDLLDYLLPAGLSCMIVKESQELREVRTVITVQDTVKVEREITESELSRLVRGKLSKTTGGNIYNTLILGEVGKNPSILSNVDIIRPLTTVKLQNGTTEELDTPEWNSFSPVVEEDVQEPET